MKRALFLDRDGVVNVNHGYVHRVEEFDWIDGIFDLARSAHRLRFEIVVVTNQAGIARGFYDEPQFWRLTDWMRERFEREGAPVDAVYFCPYHEDGLGRYRVADHPDRKPNPGMLLRAARDRGLDLARSALIGDQETDIECARRAGVGSAARYAPGTAAVETGAACVLRRLGDGACWLKDYATRSAMTTDSNPQ